MPKAILDLEIPEPIPPEPVPAPIQVLPQPPPKADEPLIRNIARDELSLKKEDLDQREELLAIMRECRDQHAETMATLQLLIDQVSGLSALILLSQEKVIEEKTVEEKMEEKIDEVHETRESGWKKFL